MQLRSYQTKAISNLRDSIHIHKKKAPLLVMPTGAGKTVVFASISKSISDNKKNVLILVHRRELIDQASKKLKNIGVKHGIIAAKYKPKKNNIQIASVQTLVRRLVHIDFFPDYIIIDEAHHAAAGSWQKILDYYDNTCQAYKIGCTATPIRLDGKGLADFFDDLVLGPGVAQLIEDKYLAPYKVFAPPLKLDLDRVKTLGGDYQKKDLEKQIDSVDIIGDAVQQYKKHADGLPAIAFCISIKHATDVCNKFKDAGYKAAIVHGEMKVGDRDEAIKGLGNGKIQILTSVDVISEGTDVPDVSAAILLRPTKSEGLYLQQVGRVLRPKPGKTAIILDHVNSTRTHGFVDDKKDWSLHSKKKKKKKGVVVPHVETCKKCFATYKPTPVCPVCGYEAQNRERFIKQEEGELEELKRKETEYIQKQTLIRSARTLEELEQVAQILGYKKGWAYNVHQSRKHKSIFNKNKIINPKKANLPMVQKERVANLFVKNFLAYEKFKEHYSDKKENHFAFIWEDLKHTKVNDIWKFIKCEKEKKDLNKSLFQEMVRYEWDIDFINNFVMACKQKKWFKNEDPTGFIT